MKYFNKLLLVLIGSLGLSLSSLQAQDLHYTLYDMSPMVTNPANTGAFLGTVRLSGIVRSQWGRTYDTPSFSADSPIVAVGKKKKDWIGVGLMFLNDVAGVNLGMGDFIKLNTNYTMLSGAYHKVLDKKSANVLTFGLQIGSVSRSLSDGGDNWNTPGIVNARVNNLPTIPTSGEFQSTNLGMQDLDKEGRLMPNSAQQLAFGLRLSSKLDNDSKLVLGAAFSNPFKPFSLSSLLGGGGGGGNTGTGGTSSNNSSQGVLISTTPPVDPNDPDQTPTVQQTGYKRPGIMKLHATLDYNLGEKLRLRPTAFVQTQAGVVEAVVQTHLGYYVTDNKDTVINGGLGYRFGDSAQFIASLEYKDWVIAGAYDYNINSYGDTGRYRNGFEIAAYYIIKIFKEPKVDPAILCPKL